MMRPDETEPKPGVRTADPELVAMTAIGRALAALDADTRARVLRWLADKYGVGS